MTDLVIISMHEKGFPQADMYADCGDMAADEFEAIGNAPDDFFTLRKGDTLEAAWRMARNRWPSAKIVEAADENESDEDC